MIRTVLWSSLVLLLLATGALPAAEAGAHPGEQMQGTNLVKPCFVYRAHARAHACARAHVRTLTGAHARTRARTRSRVHVYTQEGTRSPMLVRTFILTHDARAHPHAHGAHMHTCIPGCTTSR